MKTFVVSLALLICFSHAPHANGMEHQSEAGTITGILYSPQPYHAPAADSHTILDTIRIDGLYLLIQHRNT
jgi:hypothetical protein